MMFMLPMLCAMAFPGFLPGVLFVPVDLAHVFRPMALLLLTRVFRPSALLVMWLLVFRSVVACPLMLPPIRLVLVRVLRGRTPVLFLVLVIFVLLGITLPFVIVPAL
jgi:hypothetical protein